MFFFAHIGITVGTAIAVEHASSFVGLKHASYSGSSPQGTSLVPRTTSGWQRWTEPARFRLRRYGFTNHLDYRLIAVGSVLPDVDKFIGLEAFGRFDRSIFHTLLWFVLLIAAVTVLFRRTGDTRGLQLAYCWAMHLVLDAMWTNPQLLLWPFLGSMPAGGEFGIPEFQSYAEQALTTDWHQFVPELIGLTVVLWLAVKLIRGGRLAEFLRTGRLGNIGAETSRLAAPNGR